MTTANDELLVAFRDFLGDERFRRFAVALEENGESALYWWQDQVLDEFQRTTGRELPKSKRELMMLFKGVVPHDALSAADVPEWCVVEYLGGQCPVQAWGTCEGANWYFRARSGRWSIGVSENGADPVDVDASDEGEFYHDEEYGDGRYSAGWMPEDEARHFIVRELSRFRASRRSRGGAA